MSCYISDQIAQHCTHQETLYCDNCNSELTEDHNNIFSCDDQCGETDFYIDGYSRVPIG